MIRKHTTLEIPERDKNILDQLFEREQSLYAQIRNFDPQPQRFSVPVYQEWLTVCDLIHQEAKRPVTEPLVQTNDPYWPKNIPLTVQEIERRANNALYMDTANKRLYNNPLSACYRGEH